MPQVVPLQIIARIHSDFPEKFGIPRQSGLVKTLQADLVFEPEYRNPEALRGLEGFSHIWLLWQFSEAVRPTWSPTVRPPRLGGNTRLGVFATRSPFRPNPLGLSCVQLEGIELQTSQGPVLHIRGADLMDTTPVFDIKPYIPYADSHPEATGGFAPALPAPTLHVVIPEPWLSRVPPEKRAALVGVLELDPRPPYQLDPDRVYGLSFAGLSIHFCVAENVLTVCDILSA